ncbi:MAG: hypothetical protein MK132_25490 [Lentisphaerales bacterium]|nr:hypothetical protein [Lentisphaerales bacterium]
MKIAQVDRKEKLSTIEVEKDHQDVVHILVGYEFSWDFQRSLEIALMRTFASPSISKLLNATGEFKTRGQKRYDDTGLLVAEFMKHGYDSERGKAAIQRMNELHGRYNISNEDFLFVLSTFVLDPIDWISKYGRRSLSKEECQSLFLFWQNIGVLMHLKDIPESLQELRVFSEAYKKQKCLYASTNRQVVDSVLIVLKDWFPIGCKWMVQPAVNALIDDTMRTSFGFGKHSKCLRLILETLLKTRGFILACFPKRKASSFFCDKASRTYGANSYEINDLGSS